MNRLATALLVGSLLTAGVAAIFVAAASPPPSNPIGFGMDAGSIGAQTDAGVKPDYGTFWVGPWTLKHGWGGPDGMMSSMRQQGVTPAIHLYYWGDDISRSCIENGCWSDLHQAQKDKAGWQRLTDETIQHLNSQMKGDPVVIFLETEFNKADVQEYEPLDGYLADKAAQIHAGYPNAKVVLGLGSWNTPAWKTWDRAAAESDSIGLQGMRGSTRDSATHYDNLYADTLRNVNTAKAQFGKPVFLMDLALSTYPEPEYVQKQADGLQRFFTGMAELKAAGVEAMVYRSWKDTNMDLANYYGIAERHWGFAYQNGAYKPSAQVWIDGVKAERAGADSGPLAPFEAIFKPSANNNQWWVEVAVDASSRPAQVAASHNGGAWVVLPATSWGAYAKSFSAPAGGTMTFRAMDANGQVATSEPFPWLQPANRAPSASFSSSTSGLKVTVDASGSKDPDGDALTYKWTFGDGTQASGLTASRTYAKAGTYTVTLTVDDGKASASASQQVTVQQPNRAPTAVFDMLASGLRVDVDAARSADPDGDALAYAWTFGDGATATGKTASRTYAQAGTYTVTLVVSDGKAQSQTSQQVTVERPNRPPTAVIQASQDGLKVNVDGSGSSDADGDVLSYTWDFGDGAKASGPTASYTYPSAGVRTITLTVSDGKAVATASRDVSLAAPAFTARFTPSSGSNEWWVDVKVDGSASPVKVEARQGTGQWVVLQKTNWGTWAKSFYAPAGTIEFRATDASGQQATAQMAWLKPTAAPFAATFVPSSGSNEWWVDVKVDGSTAPVKVEARQGTGQWVVLQKTNWGTWAKSFYAPAGTIEFRATDGNGQTASSGVMEWLKPSLKVDFTPKSQSNRWWVEVDVKGTATITKVEVRKDNGAWMPMAKSDWGTWTKSMDAKGQVQFRATTADGASVTSSQYRWG